MLRDPSNVGQIRSGPVTERGGPNRCRPLDRARFLTSRGEKGHAQPSSQLDGVDKEDPREGFHRWNLEKLKKKGTPSPADAKLETRFQPAQAAQTEQEA